jgi:DDE superfamily endonuclease
LTTPDLRLRLVRLPAYSPDFNPDEHVWGWVRAEVTANTCFGTKAKVREKVGAFFRGLADRTHEVKRRRQTILQTKADGYTAAAHAILQPLTHVDPTLALVLESAQRILPWSTPNPIAFAAESAEYRMRYKSQLRALLPINVLSLEVARATGILASTRLQRLCRRW